MDTRAILDHQFVVAAYTVTWVLQLGYVAWLGLKWRAQSATRRGTTAARGRSAISGFLQDNILLSPPWLYLPRKA